MVMTVSEAIDHGKPLYLAIIIKADAVGMQDHVLHTPGDKYTRLNLVRRTLHEARNVCDIKIALRRVLTVAQGVLHCETVIGAEDETLTALIHRQVLDPGYWRAVGRKHRDPVALIGRICVGRRSIS